MEQTTNSHRGAQYGKNENPAELADEDGEIVVEIDGSQVDQVVSGVDPEDIETGPEQAILAYEAGDGTRADKRAGTTERHASGFDYPTHCWGGTFFASDAQDTHKFNILKRVQNTGEYDLSGMGGVHTNEDARIFRRFRSVCQGLELPASIKNRAGRILGEVREFPREVCKSWGSELTIAGCIVKSAEEFGYTLEFDEVYAALPKHPERQKEDARHRFERAMDDIEARHRHLNGTEDPVINNIRHLGTALDLDPLTVETAEGLYEALGDGPANRPESHSYGTTPPTMAAGYIHAVAAMLPSETQKVSGTDVAEILNLSTSAVTCPSNAVRSTVEETNIKRGVPAIAGVKPHAHGGMVPTGDLIEELVQLSDELGKSPAKTEMNEHGKYSVPTYQARFGTWSEAKMIAGV